MQFSSLLECLWDLRASLSVTFHANQLKNWRESETHKSKLKIGTGFSGLVVVVVVSWFDAFVYYQKEHDF